ncbi:hypothetical protein BH23CHL7_BH23CHL7_00300 [soil metagenome]
MEPNLSATGQPAVTITLVAYNGERWLRRCLDSVLEQQVREWRLLALDNASADRTVELLREYAAGDERIAARHSTVNLGFAAGQNRLLAEARSDYVLLLNQDVELDRGFLRAALSVFENRPMVGAVQPRLRRLSAPGERTHVLDSTGLEMHRDRRVVSRRHGQPERAADLVAGPVWGADGPAPVFRRAALLAARLPRSTGGWEVLDEDFFMYKEDVDLAWRLRRLGWQAWYEPAALAWHARTATGPRTTSVVEVARASLRAPEALRDMSWRNQRLMQTKNERLIDFARDLHSITTREALALGFMITTDLGRLSALPGLLRLLPGALRKRRHMASRRRA